MTIRAGFPLARHFSGMFRVTTDPAAINVPAPIVTPGSIELDAGNYEVTLKHPDSSDELVQAIDIEAGELSVLFFQVRPDPGYPDFGGGR